MKFAYRVVKICLYDASYWNAFLNEPFVSHNVFLLPYVFNSFQWRPAITAEINKMPKKYNDQGNDLFNNMIKVTLLDLMGNMG